MKFIIEFRTVSETSFIGEVWLEHGKKTHLIYETAYPCDFKSAVNYCAMWINSHGASYQSYIEQ